MARFDLADPRGVATQQPSNPAPRLNRLKGAKLLLVDNGKLAPIYHSLSSIPSALFDTLPEAEWSTFSRDFLRYQHSQLPGLTGEILALAPEAAVFALSDLGVSVQTMLVAAELEKKGIPTVVLATRIGEPACRAIAAPRLPALPVVMLDVYRTDAPGKIKSIVDAARPAIEAALTRMPQAPQSGPVGKGALSFSPKSEGLAAFHEFHDWLDANELGDGLPLLPPLPDRVEAMLATVPGDPDEVVYPSALTSGRSLRLRDIAANAVMTGCLPQSFPVVVAALRAISLPDFRLLQAAITTHPSGYFVLLSGKDGGKFGLSGGPGCLGPGHRGNLSVGRAVSLTVQHLFGARPGGADLTIFGSPAEIAYCMAEDVGDLPWPPLAGDRGFDAPAVFVMKAEGPRNIIESVAVTPAGICEAIVRAAASPSSNNAYVPGDMIVTLNPEHARIFTDAGWSRGDLAQAIHHGATVPRKLLEGHGAEPIRPAYMSTLENVPVTRSPADIQIVIGGAPGPQSMVALPWGFSRGQWMPVVAAG